MKVLCGCSALAGPAQLSPSSPALTLLSPPPSPSAPPADKQAQYNNEEIICERLAFHNVWSISWPQKGKMNLVKRLKRLFLGVPGMLLATIQNHAVLAGESEFKSLIFDKNLINISSVI